MPLSDKQAMNMAEDIVVLLEYHLTGYEKGKGITQEEAAGLARELGDGVVIAGYFEQAGDEFYSSAIVLDGDNGPFNVRRRYGAVWALSGCLFLHTGSAG